MKTSVRLTGLSAYWDEVSAFSTVYVERYYRQVGVFTQNVDREGSLSHEARYNAASALMAIPCYLFLLLDSPLGVKPNRLLNLAKRMILRDGLATYAKASSSLMDKLLRSLSATGLGVHFLFEEKSELTTLLFRELEYLTKGYTDERFSDVLRYTISVLGFLKKMPYMDSNFHFTAFRKWEEVEERLETLSILENASAESVRLIIQTLCGYEKLTLDIRDCRFGPGHVADLRESDTDAKLYALFKSTTWKTQRVLSSVLTTTGTTTKDRSKILPFVASDRLWTGQADAFSVSRLKFVPKDLNTSRSICMEPNDVMFVQQGLRHSVERHMRTGFMRFFVDLKDQSINQRMAKVSSLRQDCDTIDLSSASDSVHEDWLDLFPSSWKTLLLGTRSTHILVGDDRLVRPRKFAPMGSALCFPIECIIFTALAIQAYAETAFGDAFQFQDTIEVEYFIRDMIEGCTSYIDLKETGFAFRPISIYGDDIVIDSKATNRLHALLSDYGFVQNVEKSFTGYSPVRESCGIYAYMGHDITPIRFRVKDESWNEGLTALANHAKTMNYRGLRYAALHSFLEGQYDYIHETVEKGTIVFSIRSITGLVPICCL